MCTVFFAHPFTLRVTGASIMVTPFYMPGLYGISNASCDLFSRAVFLEPEVNW
jgi:hypothetical protein